MRLSLVRRPLAYSSPSCSLQPCLSQRYFSTSSSNSVSLNSFSSPFGKELCNTKVGSSETIREDISIHNLTHRYPNNDQEWGFYLAGLIDADGSFTDPFKNSPNLTIASHIKDISLAYKIRAFIEYGTVSKIGTKRACTFVSTNRLGMLKLLPLLANKSQHSIKAQRYLSLCTYYGIQFSPPLPEETPPTFNSSTTH